MRRLLFSEQYLTCKGRKESVISHASETFFLSVVVRNAKKRRSRADHWECVDEVAVDGVEGARVVVRRRADGRQVDGLQIHPSNSRRRREGKEFVSELCAPSRIIGYEMHILH